MNKVKILTDSTSDLYKVPKRNLYEEMDLDLIPLLISLGDKNYRDGIDLVPEEMYEIVEKEKQLPKSSCNSPEEYMAFFKKYVDQGYDIVFMGIGGELSASYRVASLVAEEFPEGRVFVIDSANLSSGIGLLLYYAHQLKEQGKSAAEIAAAVNKVKSRVRTSFVIDTLDYLHKGGRCSGMAKVIGTLLSLKPLIQVVDGKLVVAAKSRGKKNGLNTMINNFRVDWEANNVWTDRIMITHTVNMEEALYIHGKLLEMGVPESSIVFSEAGCVICAHCGPKCIGILYLLKEDNR